MTSKLSMLCLVALVASGCSEPVINIPCHDCECAGTEVLPELVNPTAIADATGGNVLFEGRRIEFDFGLLWQSGVCQYPYRGNGKLSYSVSLYDQAITSGILTLATASYSVEGTMPEWAQETTLPGVFKLRVFDEKVDLSAELEFGWAANTTQIVENEILHESNLLELEQGLVTPDCFPVDQTVPLSYTSTSRLRRDYGEVDVCSWDTTFGKFEGCGISLQYPSEGTYEVHFSASFYPLVLTATRTQEIRSSCED